MASCEQCWMEAGGDADEYARLLKVRTCNPEQQAGLDATDCPGCRRRTVHQYARICMACGIDFARAPGGDQGGGGAMKRAKVAPVLTALMSDLATLARNPKRSRPADARVVAFAARELHALAAVATAAEADLAALERGIGVTRAEMIGAEVPGSTARLATALARLDRVSKGGR